MDTLIIRSENILTPQGPVRGYITACGGVISGITQARPANAGRFIDATGLSVAPGFVDIHTHGGGGYDFMDGGVDDILGAAAAHLAHGTTTLVPTTTAGSTEALLHIIDSFKAAKRLKSNAPYMPGVHLEGPYFSYEQRGAQDPAYLRAPERTEYTRVLELAAGDVIRWSVAPELPGALAMGDYLHAHGVLPAIAHSNAEYSQVLEAYKHHYTLITHLYSSMSTIQRRNGYRYSGVIESAFILNDMDVELIADGHHLPAELLAMVVKIKGPQHVALITDSMRAAGMPEGDSTLGSRENGQRVIVEGGVAMLPDKSSFAGSVATADRIMRVMHLQAGVSLADTVTMISTTPARIMGLGHKKGSIRQGQDCDLVLLDESIQVKAVIAGGRVVHEA